MDVICFFLLSDTHSKALSQAIPFLINKKNNFEAHLESGIIRKSVLNMWAILSPYPEYVQSTMALSGQPAHGNLYQLWFQLFFEGCAIKVVQLALLQALKRFCRIPGDTMEVYHICIYTLFPINFSWAIKVPFLFRVLAATLHDCYRVLSYCTWLKTPSPHQDNDRNAKRKHGKPPSRHSPQSCLWSGHIKNQSVNRWRCNP